MLIATSRRSLRFSWVVKRVSGEGRWRMRKVFLPALRATVLLDREAVGLSYHWVNVREGVVEGAQVVD